MQQLAGGNAGLELQPAAQLRALEAGAREKLLAYVDLIDKSKLFKTAAAH